MTVLFILVAIAVIAGIVLLATGRLRDGLPDVDDRRVAVGMPQAPVGELLPQEIEQVRIDQALRGYRMDEVDELVDRLGAEITARDELLAQQQAEIDRLRGSGGE